MKPDRDRLIQLIKAFHDELVTTICRDLQQLHDSHYEMIDFECHVEREEQFLNTLLSDLQHPASGNFLSFVEELSEIRAEEGYSLEEFQAAFNVVEDCLWTLLVRECDQLTDFIGMWAIIGQVFRQAKDRLAQTYLEKAQSAERELEHLRKKFRVYRKVSRTGHLT